MKTRVKIEKETLVTELKDGFALFQSPSSNGIIEYDLIFTASKKFAIPTIERKFIGAEAFKNHFNYMIKVTEKHIADVVRTTIFGFIQKGHTRKLLGMDMKISDKCPEGQCIINPKDYHELMERFYTNPRDNGIISDK